MDGKKTKIVATIGPATQSREVLKRLAEAGMNVARLNFSHGTHEEHAARIKAVRSVAEELKVSIAILQDLSGPKIRVGEIAGGSVELEEGATFTLTTKAAIGTASRASVNYERLHKEITPGALLLINDGRVQVRVVRIEGQDIACEVLRGGTLSSRKGVNTPDSKLTISSLTERDRADVKFGLAHDVDFMALSFVRSAQDIHELRELLGESGIRIIAKIETQQAVQNIDEIVHAADGIMVARGDLAVEVPLEEVPFLQKTIIKKCASHGKPVITATQMLSSMVTSGTPTRAEINDIANAIFDGTDAVMLSEETAVGEHPIEAVSIMARTCKATESHLPYEEILKVRHSPRSIPASVGHAIVQCAHDVSANIILALSATGVTARLIARYRPNRPIVVATDRKKTFNQMALSFNCYPILEEPSTDIFELIERAKEAIREQQWARKGDVIVVAAGVPFAEPGNTNTMMVQRI